MSWPDLLRLEDFGAVYYQRSKSATLLFPEHLARLLVGARERSLLEVYAQSDAAIRRQLPEIKLAREVARLRRDGILDAGYRVRARLIDGRGSGAALSAPLVTHIQLTLACNLSCTHCYVPVTPQAGEGEMTTEEVCSLFRQLSAIGVPVAVLAGGEPMRRPDLFTLLDELEPCQLDAWMCTNATLVTEENAERLAASALKGVNVSLDGPDAETHDQLRGPGQFARALVGIERLMRAGIAEVKARVTVNAHNLDRLHELAPVATALGVHKVVFKAFDQVGVASAAGQLHVDRAAYLEAMHRTLELWPDDAVPAEFSEGLPSRPAHYTGLIPTFGCVGGTTSSTVMPDSAVVACGVFTDDDDWTLRDHSFAECWLGAKTITQWRRLVANDQCLECELLPVCGGGCRARAVGAGRLFTDPDPFAPCSIKEAYRAGVAPPDPVRMACGAPPTAASAPDRGGLVPLPMAGG